MEVHAPTEGSHDLSATGLSGRPFFLYSWLSGYQAEGGEGYVPHWAQKRWVEALSWNSGGICPPVFIFSCLLQAEFSFLFIPSS